MTSGINLNPIWQTPKDGGPIIMEQPQTHQVSNESICLEEYF